MDEPHLGPLPAFTTIGPAELTAVAKALRKPLSGYLGGRNDAGYWVTQLQEKWCEAFRCKYAVPCNSATSGLLAACMALEIGPGDTVWTSAYTMSATAACAKVLGANIVFIDIETMRFSMNMNNFPASLPKCIIVTNLFGHPAYLAAMRSWCDSNKVWMVEDNAQAPFAMEGKKYAGTIGHIGVFSLNVHKHIQAGEGGVIVTDSEDLAEGLRRACNHAEIYPQADGIQRPQAGLNLRMTETTAAIACVQLDRAKRIIAGRVEFAEEISEMFAGVPWITPPAARIGCKSVYYMWAAIIKEKRDMLVWHLASNGFPMRRGYTKPLNFIFGQADTPCHITNRMEYAELMTFEVCAYDPRWRQRKQMKEVAKRAIDSVA